MNVIDMEKKYRTRSKSPVRLLMTDNPGEIPNIGAWRDSRGVWRSAMWTETGQFFAFDEHHPLDLIEVKPKIKRTF